MHLSSGLMGAGCSKGMHNDLAPIDGAPGSASSSLVLSALMRSSQSLSPQNGARIMFFWSKLFENLDQSVSSTLCEFKSS